MRAHLFLGIFLAFLAAHAQAQSPNAFVFNGTVNSIDASTLSITSEEGGAAETLRLGPNWVVLQNRPASLADIKANDFIASAAVRKADGKLHSTEIVH